MLILDETEIYAPKRYPGYLWAFKLELVEYKLSSPDTCRCSSFWPPSDLLLQLSCTACSCACSLGWPEGWKEDAKIAYTSGNSICQNTEMGGWQTGLCSLISNNCLSLKGKKGHAVVNGSLAVRYHFFMIEENLLAVCWCFLTGMDRQATSALPWFASPSLLLRER